MVASAVSHPTLDRGAGASESVTIPVFTDIIRDYPIDPKTEIARLGRVRTLAEQYRETANTTVFPVCVNDIIARLGTSIEYLPLNGPNVNADSESWIAGATTKNAGEDSARVLIDMHDSAERRLFSAAHEAGHLLLEREGKSDSEWHEQVLVNVRKPNRTIDTESEHMADLFAHQLLMPREYVILLSEEGRTVKEMAKTFGVTVTTMGNRFQQLYSYGI